MINRRKLILAAAALPGLAISANLAHAGNPPVFAPQGVAINGYDPVAYFTQDTHVKGSTSLTYHWNGAEWHFATQGNRDAFARDPNAFAPQYGGYCAYAVAHSAIAKTDPDAWTVYKGKLYLNYSTYVRSQWQQDILEFIKRADANWPAVLEA